MFRKVKLPTHRVHRATRPRHFCRFLPFDQDFYRFFFQYYCFSFLFATYTDGDKFSVAAVARCTSMVKSPTENYYKLDATIAQNNEICRVVGQSSVESQQ